MLTAEQKKRKSERQRERYLENKEHILAVNAAYREKHKEEISANDKIRNKKYREENKEKEQRRQRRWNALNRAKHSERCRRWEQNNKEKRAEISRKSGKLSKLKYPNRNKARKAVEYEVRKGTLIPKPCVICGSLPTEGHHNDYKKPLDVTWMCRKHHKAWHRIFLAEE